MSTELGAADNVAKTSARVLVVRDVKYRNKSRGYESSSSSSRLDQVKSKARASAELVAFMETAIAEDTYILALVDLQFAHGKYCTWGL